MNKSQIKKIVFHSVVEYHYAHTLNVYVHMIGGTRQVQHIS